MKTPLGAVARKVFPGRYWPPRVRRVFKLPPDPRLYFWCVIFPVKEAMHAWATANRMDTGSTSTLGPADGDFLATTQHRPSLIIPEEPGKAVRLPPMLGWLLFAAPDLADDLILSHECLHAVLSARRAVRLLVLAQEVAEWPREWTDRQEHFEELVSRSSTLTLSGSSVDPDEEEHVAYSLGTTLRQVRSVKAAWLESISMRALPFISSASSTYLEI